MPYYNPTSALSIFYTTHGDRTKPAVLLIHGWCCDSHDFSWQIPFLSRTHYVIAFDLRGHGRSSVPTDVTFTIQDFVSDAIALLRHLKIEKDFIIVGHSMGGVIASVLAAQQPQLVKGLILIDPRYWIPGPACDAFVKMYKESPSAIALTSQIFPNLFAESTPEWMKTWYLRRLEGTSEHAVRETLMGGNGEGMLAREEVHTELVRGSKRGDVPRLAVYASEEDAEKERAFGIKEGVDEVLTLEGMGHWMHQVKDDEFNDILGKWLEKLGGKKE